MASKLATFFVQRTKFVYCLVYYVKKSVYKNFEAIAVFYSDHNCMYSFVIFTKRLIFSHKNLYFLLLDIWKKTWILGSLTHWNQFIKIKNLLIQTIAFLTFKTQIFVYISHNIWQILKKYLNYSGVWNLPIDHILQLPVLKKSIYKTFYKMG